MPCETAVRLLLGCLSMASFFLVVSEGPQTVIGQTRRASANSSLELPWVRKQGDAQAQGVIVFVPGVLGDRRTTWSNGLSYWPELLTKDKTFDGQDIYVYEYPSPKLGKSFSIDEVAENLRLVLSTDGVLRYKNHHVPMPQHGWPRNASLPHQIPDPGCAQGSLPLLLCYSNDRYAVCNTRGASEQKPAIWANVSDEKP